VSVELPHAQVQQSELPLALNGALVGLASSRSSSSSLLAGNGGKTEQQGVAALGPQLHECLGVGLVRAVDAQKGLLYLLTDMNEQRLQEVDVLMVGRLELPEKLSVTQQLAPPYQSLFCLGSAATGAGLIKSRNNLLRASMLRQ
jgi:polynucleotide 5'-hydroxyl-kinase GRC3/NOL9